MSDFRAKLYEIALLLIALGKTEVASSDGNTAVCLVALVTRLFCTVFLFLPFAIEHCKQASGGIVKYTRLTSRWLFRTSSAIVMMGVLAGLPALLAPGGFVLLPLTFATGVSAESTSEKHSACQCIRPAS